MTTPGELPVHADDGAVVVRPAGELDLAAAPSLRAALEGALARAEGTVRVDLGAVTFVDSTALAILVEVWRRAKEREITLCVEHPAANVRRVLGITGLDRLLCTT